MMRSIWTVGPLAILIAPLTFSMARPAFAQETVPVAAPSGPPIDEVQESISPTVVDDPLLEPIEAPAHILTDWRDAIEHVRNRSTDYRIALSQVEAARGQARMALANSLPTLQGSGNVQKHLIKGTGPNYNSPTFAVGPIPNPDTTWNLGAAFRAPILSARNWYDYGTAKARISQTEVQAEDAQRLIIGGLAQALVTVITAERLAEVTRVNLGASLETWNLNEKRSLLGAGNSIDVLRARQEVERSRAQVIEANETLRQAREALGTALGYPEAWGITSNLKLDQLRQDARDTCKSTGNIADRPDVRAAAAGAAIAQRNVKAVSFSFLPTIDFNSNFTYNSFIVSTNRHHETWTIGGSLTWHLYDGGRRYGEKKLNTALLEQSKQQSIQVERDATLQVRQSVRGVDVAKQSLDVAKRSETIAQDNANLARAKFMTGTGSSFDLVDTQRAARQTKLDVTVKEFELLRAEIVAYLALASCDL